MIWLSFKKWSSKYMRYLCYTRIYHKGKWTPFVKIKKRYKSKK